MFLFLLQRGPQECVEPISGHVILDLPLDRAPNLEQCRCGFGGFDCDLLEEQKSQLIDRLIVHGVPVAFFLIGIRPARRSGMSRHSGS
jgi:hypothetical protein